MNRLVLTTLSVHRLLIWYSTRFSAIKARADCYSTAYLHLILSRVFSFASRPGVVPTFFGVYEPIRTFWQAVPTC